MQINQRRLRLECLDYGMNRIAESIGLTSNTLILKLKSPTDKLYVSEFFQICNLLEEHFSTFIQEGDL